MAIYELEDRVYFDGGLPADIAGVEDTSVEEIETNAEDTNTGDSDSSENVSIAPETDNEDSTDNSEDNVNDSDESLDSDSDSQSNGFTDSQSSGLTDSQPDSIAAIIDSIDDCIIADDLLADQNFLIVSGDNENFDEIVDSLNDNITLIIYDSTDTFDSIIQKLKDELGDGKAVNIGIINPDISEQLLVNSEQYDDFLGQLKDLQYFDGELNLIEIENATETCQPTASNYQLTTNNNSWIVAEDINNHPPINYFSDDSAFLTTNDQDLSTEELTTEVVFINSSVIDAEEIVDDLSENAEVIYLDSGEDAIQQITDYLADKEDIDTIRIISHGNDGYIVLNGEVIDSEYLVESSEIISSWNEHLSEDADIMLYGCNLAATDEGKAFVDSFADLTGADVAASIDSTGNSGNWILEYSSNPADIQTVQIAVDGYNHNLTNYLVTNADGQTGENAITGSLAWAVNQANSNAGADEITFDETLDGTEIVLVSTLNITDDVSISGNGMDNTDIGTADGSSVFNINDGDDVTQISVTIKNISLNSASSEEMFKTAENITVDYAEVSGNYYLYVHNSNTVENPKVLLVSSSVKDFNTLNESVSDDVIVIQYAPGLDGLDDIIVLLENVMDGKKASSIGIVAHKELTNEINLTFTETMNLDSVLNNESHQEFWQDLSVNIVENGRIDLFTCDLASGTEGSELISAIEAVAGINVAASTNSTGSEAAGGNWILETDNINLANEYFKAEEIENYSYLMDEGYVSGDYKAVDDGSWNDVDIWETYGGTGWRSATVAPNGSQNIYIRLDSQDDINLDINITISNSKTLEISNNACLTVNEGYTLTIEGGSTITGITDTKGNLRINGTVTVEDEGTIEFYCASSTSCRITFGSTGVLNLNTRNEGVSPDYHQYIDLGDYVYFTQGTVNYGYQNDQDIIDGNYCNLSISGSGSKSITENTVMSGNVNVAEGATLAIAPDGDNVFTFYVAGTSEINGRIFISGIDSDNQSEYIANGAFNLTETGEITLWTDGVLELRRTMTCNADTFASESGIVKYAGGVDGGAAQIITDTAYCNLTISGANVDAASDLDINGDFIITSTGNFGAGGYTYYIGGDCYKESGGMFGRGSSTVIIDGFGANIGGFDFYNLTINNSGGSTILSKDINVYNNFKVYSTFRLDEYQLDYFGNSWSISSSNFYCDTGKVHYRNSDSETVQKIESLTYYDLTITSDGGATLEGDIEVQGELTLDCELAVNAYDEITAENLSIYSDGVINLNHSSSKVTVNSEFRMSGGAFNCGEGRFNLAGTWDSYLSGAVFDPGEGIFCYCSEGDQYVYSLIDYYDLYIYNSGVKTLSNNIIVTDDLYIASDATLDVSVNNYSITVSDDWIDSGTFNERNGTVYFTGADVHTVDTNNFTETFYNIVTSNTGTLSLSDNIRVTNNLNTGSSTTVDLNTCTLYLDNTWTKNSATLLEDAGTVNYSGSVNQTIIVETYYNLQTSGNGTKELSGAIDVNGNLTIGTNTTLDVTALNYQINVAGNWTNFGAFTERTGTVIFDGSVTQTVDTSGFTETFYNLETSNTSRLSLLDNISVANNLITADNTALDINAMTLYLNNIWTKNNATFYEDTGTVNYNRAGNQTIIAETYYNLVTSGSGVKELGGVLDVNGDLTIGSNTTLDVTNSDYQISLAGTWSNSGAFAEWEGTVVLDGGSQLINTEIFYDLIISGSGTKTFAGIITATQGIVVNSSVTLSGSTTDSADTILQADVAANSADDRVLYIYNDAAQINVTVSFLTVRYGNGVADGGGIYNNGEIVTVSNSTVSYNTVTSAGGGLYNAAGGSLTVSCSTVNNNSSGTDGSGISNYAALTVDNSTIVFNTADGLGGGFYIASGSTAALDSCTIAYNHSDNDDSGEETGGGIYADGNLSVLNTILVDNYRGNGIDTGDDYYYNSGTFTDSGYNIIKYQSGSALFSDITDYIYTGTGNNWTHGGGTVTGNLFLDDTLADNGGATLTLAFDPEDYASIAWENGYTLLATDQRGLVRITPGTIGAYAFAAEYTTNGNGTSWNDINNWVVSDGFNTYDAELIPDALNSTSITICHNMVADISENISTVTIDSGVTLTVNDGITLTLVDQFSTDLTVNGTLANVGSGALICEDGTFTVYSLNDDQNVMGAVYYHLTISGGSNSVKTLMASITVNGDLTIAADTSLDVGSDDNFAIELKGDWNNSGTFVYREGTVTLNGTLEQSITGTNSADFNNLTLNNSTGAQLLSDIDIDGTMTLDAGTFDVNTQTLTLDGAADINATLSITTGTVDSNGSFDAEGGNISFDGSGNLYLGSTVTSLGSFTKSTGTVTYDGVDQNIDNLDTDGGEYYYNLILSGSGTKTFNGTTTAINGITINADVTVSGSYVTASATVIQAATTEGSASGRTLTVYNVGEAINVTLQNITVRYGNDENGGGIYNNGETLSLYNVTISDNTASVDGGGILNDGTLTVYYSSVKNNIASVDGGAVANSDGAVMNLYNSTISENEAGVNGGGINNEGTMTVVNSTLSSNKADGKAGGIYAGNNSTTITNVTIANNYSDYDGLDEDEGGGIYLTTGTLVISNSIIADNYRGIDSAYRNDYYYDSGSLMDSGYNIIGYSSDSVGRIYWSGTGDWNWESAASESTSDVYNLVGGGSSGALSLAETLSNDGGPTDILTVASTSIAVDAIPASAGTNTYNNSVGIDQRGYYRANINSRTIGAYEYNGTSPDSSDYLTRYGESGNWRDTDLWMQYTESTGWYNVSTIPDEHTAAGRITVAYGSTVIVLTDLTIDQTVIEYGATLGIDSTTNDQTLKVVSGTTVEGADLLANGTLTVGTGDTLLIGSGAVVDSGGTLTVDGTLSFDDSSGTDNGSMYISTANPTINSLIPGDGTIIYDGVDQTVADVAYNNLTMAGTGTTILNSITVNGIFSLESTSDDLTITGSVVYGESATLNYGADRIATGVELDGNPPNITIAEGVEVIFESSITTVGSLINTGSITVSGDEDFVITAEDITTGSVEHTVEGRDVTFDATSGDITMNGDITTNNGDINFNDEVILHADSEVNSQGGDITFAYGINGPDYDLVLNSGDGVIDIGGAVSVNALSITENGDITQNKAWDINGTLYLNAGINDIILPIGTNDFSGVITAIGNDITLTDADAMILGNITANSGTLTLTAGDGITQVDGTSITADNLLLFGSGNFTLTNSGNNISILAVDIDGNFSFTQNSVFEIGMIDTTIGVTVTNVFTLSSTSIISQSEAINVGGMTVTGGGTYNFNNITSYIYGDLNIAALTELNAGAVDVNLTGSLNNEGIFITTGTLNLNGDTVQGINGGNSDLYNIVLNNVAGVQLTGDTVIENHLELSTGLFTLGTFTLTLNANADIGGTFDNTRMIVTDSTGSLRKKFARIGEFLFPIGTNNETAEYTPVTIKVTKGKFASGAYIEARVIDEKLTENTSITSYLNRYWATASNGVTLFSANVTCNYLVDDAVPQKNEIWGADYTGSWIRLNRVNSKTNTFTGTISVFGELTGVNNSVFPVSDTRPNVYNGMMMNDATQLQTLTSWRNAVDNAAENSIDSNEGFEPNEVEGIGLLLDSLITLDISAESVANGEYSIGAGVLDSDILQDGEYGIKGGSGITVNGEYDVDVSTKFIGGPSNINQEFNSEFDGIIDLSFDFEDDDNLINYEAIAVYKERHPIFKTELDLLLEKI